MRETLEYLVKAIVDEPDGVRVDVDEGSDRVTYNVVVASDDVGRVIGKHGRTINALRLIVRAGDARQGRRAEVEVTD